MAGDQLGRLRARLEADSKGVKTGVDQAKGQFRSFEKSAKGSIDSIKTVLGGLGVAISVAGFTSAIEAQLQRLDRIGKLSQTYGVAVEDLQKLSFAAGQAGIDIEVVGDATKDLFKNLASNPNLFDRWGISAEKLIGRDLPTQLGLIGDRLNMLGTNEERAAAAMELMGESGLKLLPLLADGLDGINLKAEQLAASGGIMSQEQIDRVQAANDAIDLLKTSLANIVGQIAVALAPAIEKIASGISGFVGNLERLERIAAGLEEPDKDSWTEWYYDWSGKVGRGVNFLGEPGRYHARQRQAAAAQASGLSYTQAEMDEIRRTRLAAERTAAAMSTPSW